MTFEINGFTPLGVIGQGGFGTVHRAADDAHGREVAVKILGRIADESARRRFDRERRAMGTLSGHPTIGIVYTSGFTANEEPYIVMEMIRGGSLADRLEKDGPLPSADVLELGATLAEALHHAHQGGVLHLDVKPENILMSRFGQPKIVDFGIAAIVDDEAATSTIRATPSYADPEVLDGKQGTEQSDVYGLAATLFTLLEGSPPYSSGPSGLFQVMQRVALDPVPIVDRADVSPEFAQLLHRAMAKEPADRPASMEEFARSLRAVDAEPATQRRPSRRRVDRSSTPPPVAAPLDDWPAVLGERPPLPGPVDASNPVRRVDPTPPPSRGLDPVDRRPERPVQPQEWAPSTATPPQPHGVARSAHSSGEWPQHGAVAPGPSRSANRQRRNTVAIATLGSLAVILMAVLAFVLVRRADQSADPSTPTAASEALTGPPSVPGVEVAELATDDGTLPDVVGLRIGDARAVIGASGYNVEIPSHCFDTVESQSPPAGSIGDENTIMSLQFPPCVVPDFVGLRLPQARQIVDEEFVVGMLINWPAHCDDLVLAQSVPAGTVVDPGTQIDLTLEDECSG